MIDNLEGALTAHSDCNKSFKQALDLGSCTNAATDILTRCFDVVISFDARKNVALYDEETTKKFYVVDEHEFQGLSTFFEENFLHWEKKFNRKFDYREIMVETRTLDSLKTSPDFIKIDVEGSERHVLKGAMKTIKKYKPFFPHLYLDPKSDKKQDIKNLIDFILNELK